MLERCHVSTCLHKLAFMAELGPVFCDLASLPSSNRVIQEGTRNMQWIGWHICCLKVFFNLQPYAGMGIPRGMGKIWCDNGSYIIYIYSPQRVRKQIICIAESYISAAYWFPAGNVRDMDARWRD